MKKMRFLLSQLYLLALLAMPFVATSCNDDEDPKVEITSLGIENGATVNVGQAVQLEAQVINSQGDVNYIWQVNGKEVSTESSYTFIPETKGTYTIDLIATRNNETIQKSVSVNVKMYTSSFYVVNERQYGSPGSINRYNEGVWTNDIIQGLGYTTTAGVISGDYMYIVSKTSPFLVKMKLSDNSIAGSITEEEDNVLGNNGQGNNFCIVNDETGILTTSNGAFKVELNPLTLGEKLANMDDTRNDKEDIFKVGNNIFIISDETIKVYNANDLSFVKNLEHKANTGFAQTKDGTLWAANKGKLVKIDVETLTSEEVDLPNELKVFYNQWAYTPTGLGASTTENALYFTNIVEIDESIYGKDIYKYNIETNNATKFFSAPADDKSIYGAGIQVDPRNGDVYLIYTEDGWGVHYLNTNIYIADGVTGNQKAIIDYTGSYWYPSTITFQ